MKLGRYFRSRQAADGTSSVFRGMLTLALGSGSARIISVVTIPVLSRIYTPDDYGVLSVFTALAAIMAPLLTMRYVIALPLPRTDGMAVNLLALCVGLMLSMSLLFGGLLWAFGPTLLALLSMEALLPYRWLVVLCFMGTAIYEMTTTWATRRRAYKYVAQTQFTQSASGALTKIGLGLLSVKPLGLLLGQTISFVAGAGSLIRRFWPDIRAKAHTISWTNIRRAMRSYWKYPVYRLPAQFLQDFSMRSPMLFVAARFDAATTGQFGMAVMSLSIPMNLIGQTLGRAFLAEIAAAGRSNPAQVEYLTYGVLKRMVPVALLIGAGIYFLSPWAFVTFLGAQWDLAGHLGAAMSFYIMTQLMSSPLLHILSVLDRNGVYLMFNTSRFCLVLLVFAASQYFDLAILPTIWAYSLTLSLQRVGQILTILKLLRKERHKRQSPDAMKE